MTLKIKDKTIGDLIVDIPEPPQIPSSKIENAVTDNETRIFILVTQFFFQHIYRKYECAVIDNDLIVS